MRPGSLLTKDDFLPVEDESGHAVREPSFPQLIGRAIVTRFDMAADLYFQT